VHIKDSWKIFLTTASSMHKLLLRMQMMEREMISMRHSPRLGKNVQDMILTF
jgi:hypothetical protein